MGPLSTRKWACPPGRCQGVSLLPTASCFPARGSGQLCSLSIRPSFSVWAVSLGAEDSEPGQWQLVHAGHHTLVRMLVEKSASVCLCGTRARVHEDVGGGPASPSAVAVLSLWLACGFSSVTLSVDVSLRAQDAGEPRSVRMCIFVGDKQPAVPQPSCS